MATSARTRVRIQGGSRQREQLNISLQPNSGLPGRLAEAERLTGWSRAQIARGVMEAFLDVWLAAEMARRQTLEAARSRALGLALLPPVRLRPRYAGDDRPEPGYADVVAARRSILPRVVGEAVPLEMLPVQRSGPRSRAVEPRDEPDGDDNE